MDKIEGFDLSPRSPPSRRYSRRSGEDNGRRRGNMCHGSVAIAVRIVFGGSRSLIQKMSVQADRICLTAFFIIYRENTTCVLPCNDPVIRPNPVLIRHSVLHPTDF